MLGIGGVFEFQVSGPSYFANQVWKNNMCKINFLFKFYFIPLNN